MPGASTGCVDSLEHSIGTIRAVELSVALAKRLRAGMLAGRTLVLQRVTGQGTVFVHAAGDFAEFALVADEALPAGTHALVWFDADCD